MNTQLLRYKVLFNQFIDYIGSFGFQKIDNSETKGLKLIITITCYVAIVNLYFFSIVYVQMGRPLVAATLFTFASYLVFSLIIFAFHKSFVILRNMIFWGMYFYIIIYQCIMGGYIGSTGYILYGILILNGVQLFYKILRHKYLWYALYMLTALILFFLEPIISQGMVPVSKEFVLVTYLNSFVLIASIVMLSTDYFIRRINAEKQKSDLLIRNILPESVVQQLNETEIYEPILIPSATTIFTDFVNFSKNTFHLNPQEIVKTLNQHFSVFDEIFKQNNVEKLKTIGDGYMAVGGVPLQNKTHCVDVGKAALEILAYILEQKNNNQLYDWELRIGIHTGTMVAGIIGKTKFSYDVWGNSVNLCARLEASSQANKINVSKEFMEKTKDFFEFKPRGFIEIKHGEPIEMYFLLDFKESLKSSNNTPNQLYTNLYNKLCN